MFKNRSFSIDLGNNNTLVADSTRMLLAQPSYIVFNSNHSVKAVGEQAYEMFEKTHEELTPVKPLRGGVIADFNSASLMIKELVNKAYTQRASFFSGYDHIISGVPYYTTEVERRALRDAIDQFNPRKRSLLFEPLAAAIGMGLNIQEPDGKMVIDIGGGITEIVIISLSGIAAFQSLKVAGDTFDMNIQDYFRRNFNMSIGLKTAEQVKILAGSVQEDIDPIPDTIMVKGKDLMTGIPVIRKIDHREIAFILEKSVSSIERSIIQTLETCPPELAADIYQNGMHITGGSSLLRGLKQRFEKNMKLPVHLDEQPLSSVSRGIARVLANPKKFTGVLID